MEQNKILLKTKANKTFSLKTKNEQISQNAYHRSHTYTKKKKKKNITATLFCCTQRHLKLKQRINNFFISFKILHMKMNRDHNTISYLHHTVVIVVEPTSPPLLSSLPSFAVNKSRTV